MIVWCEHCRRIVTTEPAEKHTTHSLVGIRPDILQDFMVRLVRELRITGRLEPVKR